LQKVIASHTCEQELLWLAPYYFLILFIVQAD